MQKAISQSKSEMIFKVTKISIYLLTIIENLASRLLVFNFWIILEFDEGKTVIERSMERIVNWKIETLIKFHDFQILWFRIFRKIYPRRFTLVAELLIKHPT